MIKKKQLSLILILFIFIDIHIVKRKPNRLIEYLCRSATTYYNFYIVCTFAAFLCFQNRAPYIVQIGNMYNSPIVLILLLQKKGEACLI